MSSSSIISCQPSPKTGMTLAPPRGEQSAERIRGGCVLCPGGAFWVCSLSCYNDTDQPASHPPLASHYQQQPTSGPCCLCCGGGLCGVGSNKDYDDERLEMEQRERQEARARASQPMRPPPVETREHRPSMGSPSLQGGGPPPRSQPQAPQSYPGRRAPAQTLPPHLARPDLPQGPRQSGARTQSLSTRPRPGL